MSPYKWLSKYRTRFGVIVMMAVMLLTLASPAAHANKVTTAANSTMGIAGGLAAGLGVAAIFGCIPCGVIAGGIGLGIGILQWGTADQ
jgi:hypothetical protein